VAACSSDNSNSAPPVYGDDGGDATAGSSGNPDGASEGSTPDGGSGGPDAPSDSNPGNADGGDSGPQSDAAPACSPSLSDAGCWTCPTQSSGSVEFLNQCSGTGVTCVSFDNLGRLPGFDAGLPSL